MERKTLFRIGFLAAITMSATLAFVGCAAPKVINHRQYFPYGILSKDGKKSPDVEYKVAVGSVLLGIFPCMWAPWFYELYTPIGPKAKPIEPQNEGK